MTNIVISASLVKELRERSGAGMMECKAALMECGGNMEDAIDILRKKGIAKASKKAGKIAAEGVVAVCVKADAASVTGSIIEVNAETDFVSKNAQFLELVRKLSAHSVNFKGNDVAALNDSTLPSTGRTVAAEITEGVMTIGENILIRRMAHLTVAKGIVGKYVHNTVEGDSNIGKIAVLVALEFDSQSRSEIEDFAKHVAMHIAASNPKALDIASLDKALVEKEANFLKEQSQTSGKPAEVIEKMIEGRIRKFYEEIVLLEQVSMLDGKARIKELLAELSKTVGTPVVIKGFVRFELGEGIEKKEDNFAEEVRQMATQ